MSGYRIALFVHLLGVVTLFGGIVLLQRGVARLRAATTVAEVRLWTGFLRPAGPMLPAALAILLASGLYMTARAWTVRTPFIAVAIITILGMAAVGAGIIGRRLRAIGRDAAAAGGGQIPPDLERLIQTPGAWIALSALNGAALGVLWLMTNKPGWAASVSVIAVSVVIGGIFGAIVSRSRPRTMARVPPASW
jgi:hypothetical protein